MYDYRRGESILGAFLLGGVVGAVLGMLFAPRSGKENREFVAEKAKDYWGEGMEVYETGREKVSEVYETGREKVTGAYETGREKVSGAYETGREKATETAEELRVKIDAARDRLREQVDTAATTAKDKVVEYAPVAKETVHKVGEVVKGGVETAESKAESLLDMVADKASAKSADADVVVPE
ncbi:MAG: hypothetical protein CVT66_01745 [Actinobacteria bacterium HGW-Actinobacteria-6]|nr:MAG: hypothetical protein CVT66_01745 [Actinobacteria bacterium HGW-Actinobacteria-6]